MTFFLGFPINLALVACGHKALADRIGGPCMFILLGITLVFGAYVNFMDVGWGLDSWGGYSSRTHRRGSYLTGLVVMVLCGLGAITGGIIMLVLNLG